MPGKEGSEGSKKLDKRVTRILEETRIAVPGVAAVWGFQAMSTFTDVFSKLPDSVRYAHLGAIGFSSLSLWSFERTPAYDRTAVNGDSSEELYSVGDKSYKWGLRYFSLGMSLDLGVVAYNATQNEYAA